ncbi:MULTISPECIES: ABC transporter permease [Leuconostoc]|uniref:ABC transporter permease n=1 Tax=Leuconostoc TaxID=1243 RepID=UPI0032DE77AD
MNIQSNIKYRLRDIFSYPKQNSSVLISIIISVISVLMIMAVGNGLANNIANQLKPTTSNKLSFIKNNNNSQNTDINEFNFLSGYSEVKKYELSSSDNIANTNIVINNQERYASIGNIDNFQSLKITEGTVAELKSNSIFINASSSLIRPSQVKNIIGKKIYINGILYIIKGTFTTNLLDGGTLPDIIVNSKSFNFLGLSPNKDKLTISFELKKGQSLENLEDKILDQYARQNTKGDSLIVLDDSILSKSMHDLVGKISLLVVFVASISLVISGFSISSNMYAKIAIRSKEIGLRRSLGATKKNIRAQFITEAVLIILIGVIIGIFISEILILILNMLDIDTHITINQFVIIGLIPTVIGLISSISPATIAAKKNITELLRSDYT